MNRPWKPIKLSELLEPVSRTEHVDPVKEYPLLGIRLDSGGPFHRETKLGSQVAASTLYRVRMGDFIYSRLFAWRGAFGVIGSEFDGYYVSSEFPTFEVIQQKLDSKFLHLWFRLPTTLSMVEAVCTGSTPLTRNRFKEHFFLAMQIPLPPTSEQRRVVARIEELAAKIEQARGLRRQAVAETEALLSSALRYVTRRTDGWQMKLISDCCTMSTGTTPPSHRDDYYGGDLQWYTPGDLEFSKKLSPSSRTVSDRAIAEGKVRVFEPGTILLVAIGASLGKVGLAHERCSSNQQITGVKFSSEVLPEYGFWWMRRLCNDLRAAAPQATLPIINQRRIGEFEIAIPPLAEQRRIVAYMDDLQAKVDFLKRTQAETADELDAMLPSILDKALKRNL